MGSVASIVHLSFYVSQHGLIFGAADVCRCSGAPGASGQVEEVL